MNKTSYDEIYATFVNFTGIDRETLPKTDDGKYILINSGAMLYNSHIDDSESQIICDDIMEEINLKLDNKRLILLAFCLKFIKLQNELEEYTQTWSVFTKEIGHKFYGDQIKARNANIENTHKEIIRLLGRLDTYSYLG